MLSTNVPTMKKIKPSHASTPYLSSILILSYHVNRTYISKVVTSVFPTLTPYPDFTSQMQTTFTKFHLPQYNNPNNVSLLALSRFSFNYKVNLGGGKICV